MKTTRRALFSIAASVGIISTLGAGISSATTSSDPALAECHNNCTVNFTLPLAGGTLTGYTVDQDNPSHAIGRASYVLNGRLESSIQVPNVFGDANEDHLIGQCGGSDGRNCLVGYQMGVHSASITPVRLNGTRLQAGTAQGGAAGRVFVGQLGGDSTPDGVLRDSTWDPDYADAPQFWATYRNENGELTLTGCSTPTLNYYEPFPTTLLTAPCPPLD